jgi:diphosphomevalonate decarboxylase
MFQSCWSAPSNIAFVKYWGKKGDQLPINPSVSGTLNSCRSITRLEVLDEDSSFDLAFEFEGKPSDSFRKKIIGKFEKYFFNEVPVLKNMRISLKSRNTFPHSCGIASSASFYASLALNLTELEGKYEVNSPEFFNRASFLARLGSGSACRSLFGPITAWGDASLEFGNTWNEIHDDFLNMKDFVCLVSAKEKKVSSTVGHALMENHPYKESRIENANENFKETQEILKQGDWQKFSKVLEDEANQLHGMMMMSTPSFYLLEPNSIKLIEAFRNWREAHNIKAGYTIDAGPNIHIICHRDEADKVSSFIDEHKDLLEDGRYLADDLNGKVAKENEF